MSIAIFTAGDSPALRYLASMIRRSYRKIDGHHLPKRLRGREK